MICVKGTTTGRTEVTDLSMFMSCFFVCKLALLWPGPVLTISWRQARLIFGRRYLSIGNLQHSFMLKQFLYRLQKVQLNVDGWL